MPKCSVSIVGGGPVGLFTALLLERMGISYRLFERYSAPMGHPKAHWLSAQSKQLLSQISGLVESINSQQEDWQHFRYYKYVERLLGTQLGQTDHFGNDTQIAFKRSRQLFNHEPSQISQDVLVDLLLKQLKNPQSLSYSKDITSIVESSETQKVCYDSNGNQLARSDYVVLCAGAKTSLRQQLGFSWSQDDNYGTFINIYFHSRQLGQALKSDPAMLYFIYNDDTPMVLVNHSLDRGRFVAQILNCRPFVDLLKQYSPEQLIRTGMSPALRSQVTDISIQNVGEWMLEARTSQQMHINNIFLAGDSAHTYTPAGGFGLNSGLQDAHALAHTINALVRNPKANSKAFSNQYCKERTTVNQAYRDKSIENFGHVRRIQNELGLERAYEGFKKVYDLGLGNQNQFVLPSFLNNAFDTARKLTLKSIFRLKPIKPTLNLLFEEFDASLIKQSKDFQKIVEMARNGKTYSFIVPQESQLSQIQKTYGSVERQNILINSSFEAARGDGMRLLL